MTRTPRTATLSWNMESKLARVAELELIEATQKLSPEERVNAFLAHSRLMFELRAAAESEPQRNEVNRE